GPVAAGEVVPRPAEVAVRREQLAEGGVVAREQGEDRHEERGNEERECPPRPGDEERHREAGGERRRGEFERHRQTGEEAADGEGEATLRRARAASHGGGFPAENAHHLAGAWLLRAAENHGYHDATDPGADVDRRPKER